MDKTYNQSISSRLNDSCQLNAISWNATGIMSSGNHLSGILQTRNIDICGISEHWLFEKDNHFLDCIHKDYVSHAVCDFGLSVPNPARRVGKGGVAIMWHRRHTNNIKLLDISDDRIVGVEFAFNGLLYYFIQVYFPTTSYPIELFQDYIHKLYELHECYGKHGIVIYMGDFNVELNSNTNNRSNRLLNALHIMQLVAVTTTSLRSGDTVSYTPFNGTGGTLIDHLIVPRTKFDMVIKCEVSNECASNTSNHRPIIFALRTINPEQSERTPA